MDQAHARVNPQTLVTAGHGSADDDKAVNLCPFIEALQAYTHSAKVDIVAHSLGVTLARDVMRRYPALARDVVGFVGIAGGNEGTSICRGLEDSYYGCNEVAPGSPWLAWLNGPRGSLETPGPTKWMTIHSGSAGDPYFDPPYDEDSPRLVGALDVAFPGANHNDLRVDPAEVDTYLPFLLRHGQAGPYAAWVRRSSHGGSSEPSRMACKAASFAAYQNSPVRWRGALPESSAWGQLQPGLDALMSRSGIGQPYVQRRDQHLTSVRCHSGLVSADYEARGS